MECGTVPGGRSKVSRLHFTILVFFSLALGHGCDSLSIQTPQSASDDSGPSFEESNPNTDNTAIWDPDLFFCGLTKCLFQTVLCVLEPACRETLLCNAECGSKSVRSEQQACHLVCQLALGQESNTYSPLVQCFAENGCLPTLPEGTDGQCPVTSDNIHNVIVLENLDEIQGTWREIRGLNCGVPGSNWEGGYDALPCRSDSWVYYAYQWWYHTSFCAPSGDGSCNEEGVVHLIGEPRISDQEPGLLEVPYVNPPLQPQDERWYILSRPDPDWIMYTYCGSTPVGEYAGLNIMTRAPEPSDSTMPPEVDAAFRQAAEEFDFSYEDMCITDQSQCPPITAEGDVEAWVEGF